MRYISMLIIYFFASILHAEEILPARCTPWVVSGELLFLPQKKSTVFMVHNLSSSDLWVTHPVSESSVTPGWSSHLTAGNWSALIANEAWELSCIESKPGHEQQVSCASVLAVCSWHAASLPLKAKDTPWAAEDMLLSPLTAYIKRRGFILSKDES
jgi:hypothetical protein